MWILALSAVSAALAPYGSDLVVKLDYAHFQGTKETGICGALDYICGKEKMWDAFLNVPFAQPAQRFRPPIQVAAVQNPKLLDAKNVGHACVGNKNHFLNAGAVFSEDCLNLNVYIQSGVDRTKTKLPVFVFAYGGKFVESYNGYSMWHGGAKNILNHGKSTYLSRKRCHICYSKLSCWDFWLLRIAGTSRNELFKSWIDGYGTLFQVGPKIHYCIRW